MFTAEEVDLHCLSGIRLFFKINDVNNYNNTHLALYEHKTVSTATDEIFGQNSTERSRFRENLHKLKPNDTAGLSYEIMFVSNKLYMITTNIDVSDGLVNGAVGNLIHVQFDNDAQMSYIWLKFSHLRIGDKLRKKTAAFSRSIGLDNTVTPIVRRNVFP